MIVILRVGIVGSAWELEYRCFLPFVFVQILCLINSIENILCFLCCRGKNQGLIHARLVQKKKDFF